jgi:hypothetical protein
MALTSLATKYSPSPDAHEQRAPLARRDDLAGLAPVHHRDAVRALDEVQRLEHRVLEAAVVRALDEVGEHLGVGVRGDGVAGLLEHRPDRRRVLDDPVVHHRHLALLVGVRVRVALGGGPCVAQRVWAMPNVPSTGRRPDGRLEPRDLARGLAGLDAVAVLHGHAGRVVAAVLEPLEALDQQGRGRPGADVSDDAAHCRGS